MIMFHVITRHLVKSCTMKPIAQETIIIFGRGVWFVNVGYLSLNLVVRRSPWIEFIILDAARLPEVPLCQLHLSHKVIQNPEYVFIFASGGSSHKYIVPTLCSAWICFKNNLSSRISGVCMQLLHQPNSRPHHNLKGAAVQMQLAVR